MIPTLSKVESPPNSIRSARLQTLSPVTCLRDALHEERTLLSSPLRGTQYSHRVSQGRGLVPFLIKRALCSHPRGRLLFPGTCLGHTLTLRSGQTRCHSSGQYTEGEAPLLGSILTLLNMEMGSEKWSHCNIFMFRLTGKLHLGAYG